MTNATAIAGEFADLRSVKTRSCVQIIIEVPIEQGAEIVRMFGFPQPGKPVRVAVARLKPEHDESPLAPIARALEDKAKGERERREWSSLSPAQQAGIRCNEEAFWKFLSEMSDDDESFGPQLIHSTDSAAGYVRLICSIKSRADLTTNPQAREKWHSLDVSYNNWLHGLTPDSAETETAA